MKNLYAPWRSPYSSSIDKAKENEGSRQDCVFCLSNEHPSDASHFILKRYNYCYAILNKYPYNAGHLMVIPFAHVQDLEQVEPHARHEIMDVVTLCTEILKKKLKCHGINVGLNVGRASGAGIPQHLHMHVLPRWEGDTNFLPTLANTKVISFDLQEIYDLLKSDFK